MQLFTMPSSKRGYSIMHHLPILVSILLILVPVALFALVAWRLLFRRGSRGNVPSAEEVRSRVQSLDQESKEIINDLQSYYGPRLSVETFSTLCLATSLAIEQ